MPYQPSQYQEPRDPRLPDVPIPGAVWTAEQIDRNSEKLQRFFDPKRVRLPNIAGRLTMAPRQVHDRISRWRMPDEPSRFLWLRGEYDPSIGSANKVTTMAGSLVEQARKVDVAIISYFCKQSNNRPREAVTAILYALIRQTVELLPPESTTTIDMSEERFKGLNGEADTWDAALVLFRDAIGLLNSLNCKGFCVLEGVHWLEGKSTDSSLHQLLETLGSTNLKVLFATTGKSTVLLNAIKQRDQIDLSCYGNDDW